MSVDLVLGTLGLPPRNQVNPIDAHYMLFSEANCSLVAMIGAARMGLHIHSRSVGRI